MPLCTEFILFIYNSVKWGLLGPTSLSSFYDLKGLDQGQQGEWAMEVSATFYSFCIVDDKSVSIVDNWSNHLYESLLRKNDLIWCCYSCLGLDQKGIQGCRFYDNDLCTLVSTEGTVWIIIRKAQVVQFTWSDTHCWFRIRLMKKKVDWTKPLLNLMASKSSLTVFCRKWSK